MTFNPLFYLSNGDLVSDVIPNHHFFVSNHYL